MADLIKWHSLSLAERVLANPDSPARVRRAARRVLAREYDKMIDQELEEFWQQQLTESYWDGSNNAY